VAPAACSTAVTSELPDWDGYIRARGGGVFHSPRWGRLMHRVYGNEPYYITASRGGETVGVLQLVCQRSVIFGSHLCSLPYFDVAGILADDAAAAEALTQRAEQLLGELAVSWVELRQGTSLPRPLPQRDDKVTLHLDLPAEGSELWDGLKAKVRNQVRKAQKFELTVASGGAEVLGDFYDVYALTMRDLGSPAHSRRFFAAIIEAFPESAKVFAVRQGKKVLAGSLTMSDDRALHVPWAGNDWRVRESCANMLLYWSMLQDACCSGRGVFDFGRSTRGSGTYQFKKQWGAREVPLYWQYLLPAGAALPELRPDSPKYRLMVTCWRRLPVGLASLLGPWIIAKLS
jgi:FemAB-related protein (PEP-CTERM system-associated)